MEAVDAEEAGTSQDPVEERQPQSQRDGYPFTKTRTKEIELENATREKSKNATKGDGRHQ